MIVVVLAGFGVAGWYQRVSSPPSGTTTSGQPEPADLEPALVTQPDRPTPAGPFEVVATVPADDATGVDPQTGFRLQVTAPVDQAALSAVDIAVTSSGVQTGHSVRAGSLSTDLTGQSLTFALDRPLAPRTGYAITVSGIRSMDGQMLPATTVVFTTGVRAVASDAFEGQLLAELPGATTVAVGPDGHLYASSFFGTITRFELAADGTPTGRREVLLERTDRHFIGFDFQPDAPGVVWVSQWAAAPTDAFSTEIARYDLTVGVESEQTKVTGLPRHPSGDHSVQSIRFRGSKLYVTVGSATTGGARSLRSWGEPILVETPVTAAILEVDWADLGSGIDLSDGAVGPATRPVRLFATGLRNPYDLVWHANGNLYANINQNGGLGQGDSGAPTEGPCAGLPEFVDSHLIADTLNLVKRGGYYGHPNPARDECVVMGGGSGPFAVGGYPAGQAPEPAFDDRLILSYGDTASGPGISVNGIDEYRAGGPLEGRLLAADSAGSRAVLVIDVIGGTERLQLAGPIEKLSNPVGDAFTFVHPLDVAVHPLGSVAVADFGGWSGTDFGEGGAIHLLTPTDG